MAIDFSSLVKLTGHDIAAPEAAADEPKPKAAPRPAPPQMSQRKLTHIEGLKAQIKKEIEAGGDALNLFRLAVEGVALLTSDTAFFNDVIHDLCRIWGDVFGEPIPKEWERDATVQRLKKLQAAETAASDAEKKRIGRAIAAHNARIEKLEKEIEEYYSTHEKIDPFYCP